MRTGRVCNQGKVALGKRGGPLGAFRVADPTRPPRMHACRHSSVLPLEYASKVWISRGGPDMSLFAEARRRNLFRVGVAYAIVAWLLIEVASVVLPTFKAPEWVMQVFTFLLILGFPLALIFAWAFELTPEGLKREAEVDRTESITHVTGRKLDFAIIGLLVIAVVFLVIDNYVLEAEPEQASVAREKSIAVLLFDNLSEDAATQPFTNGIHDDILTQISKIRALKVIARTSMERLDPNLSIPEIGTKLGVATVLEGGVQRVRRSHQESTCSSSTAKRRPTSGPRRMTAN